MDTHTPPSSLAQKPKSLKLLFQSSYLLGLAAFASLGGFLFGYDQGVVSGVLTMESFGATFPRSNYTSLLATGVYGIVNCLSTIPAILLIDRLGRRPLLMAGAAGTFISLVIVGAIIGAYGSSLADNKVDGWVAVAFIYIYDVNFSYSFAPIGWVLPSEIFNLTIRSKAISITTSTTWMCNFIIGLVTPDMLAKITWGTYIFFAAFCLIAFAFTYFFVPETCAQTLEDMDLVFGDTAAHEEKERLRQIEVQLCGVRVNGNDLEKGPSEAVFNNDEEV